jgi:radical SAM protein with 4Fe4S-binding SPASM domain
MYYSPYVERPSWINVRRARLKAPELSSDEELERIQKLEADTSRTLSLIDELIAMGTRRLCFSGGEVFLHKNALEFMGRAKHAGATSMAFTGGHMLDRAKIDELLKMGFDDLKVTTMAGTHEGYVRTHPGIKDTAFDQLRENLLYLAERKEALGVQRPKLSLQFIVVQQNFDGTVDFAEFANHLRAEQIEYHPFHDFRDAGLSKLSLTSEEASYTRGQLIEARAYLESKGIKHNIGDLLLVFGGQADTKALYHVIPCYVGYLLALIDVEGMVYPCARYYTPLGNIYETKFHDIWNSHAYRRFRKEAITINRRQTPVSCADCYKCCHYSENLAVYRKLHPTIGRSTKLERLSPTASI